MVMTAVDGDSAHRAGRAQVFACSAAYAELFVHHRNKNACSISIHHTDGAHRTMTLTIAAFRTFLRYAETAVHAGSADVILSLFFCRNPDNGSAGAQLRTLCTLGAAIAILIAHLRLH